MSYVVALFFSTFGHRSRIFSSTLLLQGCFNSMDSRT